MDDKINQPKRIKRISQKVFITIGGFFVLLTTTIILVPFVSFQNGATNFIPNDALVAFIFHDDNAAFERVAEFAPILKNLGSIPKDDLALIVLPSPFTVGVVAHIENPQVLMELDRALDQGTAITPLGNHGVAIGSSQFGQRLAESEPVPWWIGARLAWNRWQHAGSFVWSLDLQTPWALGIMDTDDGRVNFTIPSDGPSKIDARTLRPIVHNALQDLAQAILPTTRLVSLPDGTMINELRSDQDAFSWKETALNDQSVWTLYKEKTTIFSYEQVTKNENVCVGGASGGLSIIPRSGIDFPTFSIISLKRAIVICF